MNQTVKTILNVLKYILAGILGLAVLFVIVRNVGKAVNNTVPKDGINETVIVSLNDSKQWINIYGKNKENPVLLYLHGGPGKSFSYADYIVLRKLSDVYTVVEWDQRDSGLSWSKEQNGTQITAEQMTEDGIGMTEFLCDYLGKEKVTLLGCSFGAVYGANLIQKKPEYYEALIIIENDGFLYDELSPFDKFRGIVFNPYYDLNDFFRVFSIEKRYKNDLESYPYYDLTHNGGFEMISISDIPDSEVSIYSMPEDGDWLEFVRDVYEINKKTNAEEMDEIKNPEESEDAEGTENNVTDDII